MKTSLLLFAVAGCLALPAVSHADMPATKKNAHQSPATTATAAPRRARTVYYIGPSAPTGSHIPLIRRSYGGRIGSMSPTAYGALQIQETGALDVATALYKLDPSISIR